MSGFAHLLKREIKLAFRERAETLLVVLFFVLGAVLFPFGVGPEPNMLARIAAGIVWVMALFAAMLSLERMFLGDYEDGSLEQLALRPQPLEVAVGAKVAAHWLTTALPLVVAAPVIAIMLRLEPDALPTLVLAMLAGTPAISLVGAVGAALTLGARRGGVLLSLLVLPLMVPILILGAAAVDAALTGGMARPHILILTALSLVAAVLCPFAAAAALRQALE
jgi:heme exporter protein B